MICELTALPQPLIPHSEWIYGSKTDETGDTIQVRYAELLAQNHSTLGRLKSGTATGRGKGRGNDDDDDNRSGCIVG